MVIPFALQVASAVKNASFQPGYYSGCIYLSFDKVISQWLPHNCITWINFFYFSVSECHQIALCFLIRIVNFDSKYKDVFRDVGILEVLTNCLKQYTSDLKEKFESKLECLKLCISGCFLLIGYVENSFCFKFTFFYFWCFLC